MMSTPQTAEQVTAKIGAPGEVETVFLLLEHLAANGRARMAGAGGPGSATFSK
jgi:glucose-6-phosphate isomerase